MKKTSLTAASLRLILSIFLFVIIALGILLFSFAYSKLKDAAVDVSHSVADASASQNNLQNLQKLKQDLAAKQDVVTRAENIVAESRSYEYQNQIINDLNDYAARAGLSITTIDFSSAQAGTGPTTTPGTAAPATPSTTINGVKSTFVSVTLKNPVNYTGVLRFLKSIEQNLTKMQVSNIGLSKADDGGVSSNALNIEVYIK
jgi:hypothetical protein